MKTIISFVLVLFVAVQAFAVQTALTVQELSETPYLQSLTDADEANGNSVANPNGDVFLTLSNPGGNTAVATIVSPNLSYTLPGYGTVRKISLEVSLAAGETELVGPFQTRPWNNSSGQLILAFTGAGSTSVALKAYRLSPTLRR